MSNERFREACSIAGIAFLMALIVAAVVSTELGIEECLNPALKS